MDSVETYRGFNIRMSIVEQTTHWTCAVTFEREDGEASKATPPAFEHTVSKIAAGALNLGADLVRRAEAQIDGWYEKGNG